jgi:hypothetical protein
MQMAVLLPGLTYLLHLFKYSQPFYEHKHVRERMERHWLDWTFAVWMALVGPTTLTLTLRVWSKDHGRLGTVRGWRLKPCFTSLNFSFWR